MGMMIGVVLHFVVHPYIYVPLISGSQISDLGSQISDLPLPRAFISPKPSSNLTRNMMDLAQITLKDAQVSARGAKSCLVRGTDGQKLSSVLGTAQDPISTPFGASSFNSEDTTRKTIEFSLSPEQEKSWDAFDTYILGYLAKHSYRLFKRIMTEDQVKENYRSPVSRKGDYRATLRCKINVSGSNAVRVWDAKKERIELPEDLRQLDLVAKVSLQSMWMMSKEYGFVLLCTDIQVRSSAAECPFDEAGDFASAFGGA